MPAGSGFTTPQKKKTECAYGLIYILSLNVSSCLYLLILPRRELRLYLEVKHDWRIFFKSLGDS